jgi:hypothetical protein
LLGIKVDGGFVGGAYGTVVVSFVIFFILSHVGAAVEVGD